MVTLDDDEVSAIVAQLVMHENRVDPSDVDLLQTGATALPALAKILDRYIHAKAEREAVNESAPCTHELTELLGHRTRDGRATLDNAVRRCARCLKMLP